MAKDVGAGFKRLKPAPTVSEGWWMTAEN